MKSAEDTPGALKIPFFTSIKLGLSFGAAFALVESINSVYMYYPWFRTEGVVIALNVELLGLAIYVPSILILSLLVSALLYILKASGIWDRALVFHEEILSASLVWLLAFILLESLPPPVKVWGMFLQASVFLAAGILAALGAAAVVHRIKNSPKLPGPAVTLSLLVICGFALNHLFITLLLRVKVHVYYMMLEVVVLVIFAAILFLLGLKTAGSKKRAFKYIWSAVCLLLLLSPIAAYTPREFPPRAGEPKSPKNIMIIVSDTCRADALGAYGGANSTPNIDRLAREGVVFKNAYSQAPWTLPSMLSAVSSLYPSVMQRGRLYRTPSAVTTFTEVLHSYGYFTKLLTANSALSSAAGFTQGFDEFTIYIHFSRTHSRTPLPMFEKLMYLYLRAFDLSMLPDLTDTITRKTLKFLDSGDLPEPFFLWLHYMDPHTPYNPPERFIGRKFKTQLNRPFVPNNPWHISGDYTDPQDEDIRIGIIHLTSEDKAFLHYLYDAEVRYLDEMIGDLIGKMDERGLDDNTLVIFTSDHGEEFWEHGDWGHGQSLFNELIHIPLIIWGAGLPHKEIETQVELIDLAPTLLELAGIPVPEEFQGQSLVDLIKGGEGGSGYAFSEASRHFQEYKSIIDNSHKLIWGQETRHYELYDLKNDMEEIKDIYHPDNPDFKRLERDFWPWADENLRRQAEVSGKEPLPEHEEEIKRRLKALGYLK